MRFVNNIRVFDENLLYETALNKDCDRQIEWVTIKIIDSRKWGFVGTASFFVPIQVNRICIRIEITE